MKKNIGINQFLLKHYIVKKVSFLVFFHQELVCLCEVFYEPGDRVLFETT
jgi:hypothetical protein